MIVTIEIEAETISEVYTHLTVLKKKIVKEAKRLKLNPLEDELPVDVDLDDSNCYGTHEVTITHN